MSAPALPDLAEAANGASYQQIKHWQLPTRPTKVKGNNHATDWGDRPSVELDAIPPGELRALVQRCIEQHIDRDQLDHLRVVENEERQLLRIFGQQVAGEGAQ